ncbi:MAG: hypothetical protein ACI37Q_08435 [Candidatus Gastranaerophilaceae bacterium]
MVKILDCTIRDGGHITNWNFEDEYVIDLIKTLNNSKITYCEIGYRNHYETAEKGKFYNCTPQILEKFYKVKGNLQIGIMTDIKRYSENDFAGAENDCLDFIRIACHPEDIKKTLATAEYLKSLGYHIFIQLMDVTNIDTEGYLALFEWQNKDILESLYFADTYGKITPNEVENYYNKFKILGFEKISFHGHNNMQMALNNTLKALNLGAYSIDVTQNGIGRNGGNLSAKEFFNTTL